jgi:cyclomaltodextrinase / maltogenic alpha-amylase / neopullulanase
MRFRFPVAALALLLSLAACSPPPLVATTQATAEEVPFTVEQRVPDWAKDAIWYQIFPERFRDGDPTNNPTRASLEFPVDGRVPESWAITPWTSDWYARAEWEVEKGPDFYEHGVFDRRFGGDLQGVIDMLPYLDSLGVNALYFNPVFYARSLHKYDGNSFHHVDPHFGPDPAGDFALMAQETADPATWQWTQADLLFLRLVREARARDIRIVIDGVFNHTGRDFFAFADLMERQQASPYRDWYVVEEFYEPDVPGSEFRYAGWWGVHTLPEFAENEDGTDLHPGPKQYVMDATRRWMAPVVNGVRQPGIDGWRLDVANEVPIGFWRDWHALVYELNPEAYTVAEIWDDAEDFLAAGGFSATMNYHAFAYPVKGFLIDHTIPPSEFARLLEYRKTAYPERVRFALQNLIDSHDTDRLASMAVNAKSPEDYTDPTRFDYDRNVSPRWYPAYDVRRPVATEWEIVRLVAMFKMTYLGAPMIYYGTEAGMWGADDPDDRKPMVWPDLVYDVEQAHPLREDRPADPVAFDYPLFHYYQELIALRNGSDALRRGTFATLLADDDASVFAFARQLDEEVYVVVLNRSDQAQTVSFSTPPGTYEMATSSTERGLRMAHIDNGLELYVSRQTGVVLRRIAP